MKIPKIIHQTWKSKRIPKPLKVLSQTWKTNHPDWQYYLWTDKTNREFVKKNFPELLKAYDEFQTNIQRADVIRYLILFKIGGVYVDLDFESFENLESLLQNDSCVFAVEPESHCIMHKVNDLLCNAFMASIPEHPFFSLLIKESVKPVSKMLNRNTMVMESTGPFMITRVYEQNKCNVDLKILESHYVYPLTRNEVLLMMNGENVSCDVQDKLDRSVAVHYWLNSWVV